MSRPGSSIEYVSTFNVPSPSKRARENLCFTSIASSNYCMASFCRLLFACSQSPAEGTSAARIIVEETPPNYVRLTQEEMATSNLAVAPAIRGEFRRFRNFQGIVGANEHALGGGHHRRARSRRGRACRPRSRGQQPGSCWQFSPAVTLEQLSRPISKPARTCMSPNMLRHARQDYWQKMASALGRTSVAKEK